MDYYTPSQAERSLPLVKKIVEDILKTGQEMKNLSVISSVKTENNPELISLKEKLGEYLKELEELNCYFKDWNFQTGLVDFPAIIDGKEVFLCWKCDEDEITYYHPIDEGFSARQPIPSQYYNE